MLEEHVVEPDLLGVEHDVTFALCVGVLVVEPVVFAVVLFVVLVGLLLVVGLVEMTNGVAAAVVGG